MGTLRHKIKNEKGQALVEMALALPLLLLLLWGIVEFGRLGHAYLTVTHAAREGARLGAVGYSDEAINDEILRRTASLPQSNLTIQITPSEQGRHTGTSLNVELEYSMEFLLPILAKALPDPYPVNTVSIMRVE